VFVPRAQGGDEDDGYLMTFTYHNNRKVRVAVILAPLVLVTKELLFMHRFQSL